MCDLGRRVGKLEEQAAAPCEGVKEIRLEMESVIRSIDEHTECLAYHADRLNDLEFKVTGK
jgi:hypothetical protein